MFTPNLLNRSLQQLRENILLPEEFALMAKSQAADYQVQLDSAVQGQSLADFAWSLGKQELEGCLMEFLTGTSPRQAGLLKILELRMSSRLTKLIWALVQYDYDQPGMKRLAALAAADPACAEELLVRLYGQEQDVVAAAVEILKEEGEKIYPFITKYHLSPKSPLERAIALRFFQRADERDFLVNEQYFLELIENSSGLDLKPCLINYLEQDWRHFASRRINRAFLSLFGMPEESGSVIWEGFDPSLIRRFKQLIFIDLMEAHFGPDSKKNNLFSRFYEDIHTLRFLGDGTTMVLDFGQFGIVDFQHLTEHSYLMEKKILEMSMAHFEEGEKPSWLKKGQQVEARDVIIEEKSSDVLILNLAGVGKLFVRDLMEELMRKEEGLWPVRFRHAITRFQLDNF